MMRYELWFSASENSYELIGESVDPSRLDIRSEDAKPIATFEAESWEEAQELKHRFLGWEPYKK